jgi:hypothetical protein
MSSPQQRTAPRFRAEHRVRVHSDHWGVPVDLRCNDLSRGGAFVETASPPPLHEDVELELVPQGPSCRVKAIVAHIISPERALADGRTPGFGAMFQHLTAPQHQVIDGLLEQARAAERAHDSRPRLAPVRSPSVNVEVDNLLHELKTHLGKIKEADASTVLQLPKDANARAAERAMLTLSKRYHPHKFARYGSAELQRLASEIFVVIQRAHMRYVHDLQRGLRSSGIQARGGGNGSGSAPERAVGDK